MSLAQYENVCKGKFQEILDAQIFSSRQINDKLDIMHNRMFVDNGKPCIQTRLDRNERMWKVTAWIVMVVCAASIAQLTRGVYEHVVEDRASAKVLWADPNSQTVSNSQ